MAFEGLDVIVILSVSAALVLICVSFHGLAIQSVARPLFRKREFSFYRIGLLIFAAIVAHLVEIIFFQIAYVWLDPIDRHGRIVGTENIDWYDLFYFSAVTYTSTGYGDFLPTGNLRLLATIEALTGMIMIAWTASFAFLVMQRYWQDQDRVNDLK